ncbi:FAD/NAD(P)-binding protein [Stieleria sp. JC731]|uniref:FAD/NAD(P)-binding protein n=1 Tax=Pirellulaceae TaxID=2691357 RepID=UPI001E31B771|nr:FAD/NAD(P)-binding domain-containing protein [Stieleria sp. JC731]MCC9600457.1 FAD/NAD(P)-binding protein [Stieleria sp. JC731]
MSTISISSVDTADSFEYSPAIRLAIIGCGPRGSYCLESLLRKLKAADKAGDFDITIFEPSDFPGAGLVYDPRQPHYLRMNLAASLINFWTSSKQTRRSRPAHQTLLSWLSKRYPLHARDDAYVPRAIVGEYLHECFEDTVLELSKYCHIQRVRQKVVDLRHQQGAWIAITEGKDWSFDEVVITTGHEGLRCSNRVCQVLHSDPGQDDSRMIAALPFDELTRCQMSDQAEVNVTGFGLTAIDAVLTLTEGRGGEFIRDEAGDRLSYIPSGNEPALINLISRSGRPMLAKPTSKVEPIEDSFWQPYREQLQSLRSSFGEIHFQRQIWPVVCEAAASLLRRHGIESDRESVFSWMRSWNRYSMNHSVAIRTMIESFLVATAQRPRDIPYALGSAWKTLYPEIVELISHGGLCDQSWAGYRRTAAEMERIAFGPPAETVEKLVSLARAGLIRSRCDRDVEAKPNQVTAVLAKPDEPEDDGLVEKMIQQGYLQHDKVTGAIMVDRKGRVIAPRGGNNLAIFGRCTEGVVIGNDTLSRTLHQHIERWADTMVARQSKPVSF